MITGTYLCAQICLVCNYRVGDKALRTNRCFRFNNRIFNFGGKTNFYAIADYCARTNKRIITYQAVCANHYRTLNNGTVTNTGIRADNNFTCSFINNSELLRDTGRATATVNTYLSALKGVAKEAWMLRLMDVESFQHIRAVRNLRGSRLPSGRALPQGEIRALFAVCEADRSCLGARDAAMLAVILGCGLRRSEVVSLDLRDVVTQDRALRVLGKGNKERLAYVPAGAWQRLQIWIDEIRGETPGPLFTRIRRFGDVTLNRLTDQAVYHILQVRQGQAGITKCSPHDLRRTFATAMLDNGEDLITVKDAMGHASVTTTQQYDRRGEQRLQDARDRLNLI